MKRSVVSALFVLMGIQVPAFAWSPVFECDGRALVIDEMCSSYRGVPCYMVLRQLVINDKGIADYLHRSGVYPDLQGDGRIIEGDRVHRDARDGSKFSTTRHTSNGASVSVTIERRGEGAYLEAFAERAYYSDDGKVYWEKLAKLADWTFQKCWNRGPIDSR